MQVASGGKRQGRIFCDINITPLTDIFLVLLIIMMVVAPMMHHLRKDIKPPKVVNGSQVEQGPLTVEVTQDGTFYVDGKPISVDALKTTLVDHGKKQPEKNVIIRADKATKSGAVMKILAAARDAEYQKVTLSGEPLSESRQGTLQQPPPNEESRP